MNDKRAVIMIGLQGSGKSEYVRKNIPPEYIRISQDVLNTRNKERMLMEKCFQNGLSFVVDNTNPTVEDRARYITPARENGYKIIGIFMQSRLKDCIERNNKREGKARIPSKAIAATSNRLEMPTYTEGFDELFFVQMEDGRFVISEWRQNDEV